MLEECARQLRIESVRTDTRLDSGREQDDGAVVASRRWFVQNAGEQVALSIRKRHRTRTGCHARSSQAAVAAKRLGAVS
jgi:hypothetical protein